jgi:hypothetical protein
MFLHRRPFGAGIGLPFANEILRRHGASIGTGSRAGPSLGMGEGRKIFPAPRGREAFGEG